MFKIIFSSIEGLDDEDLNKMNFSELFGLVDYHEQKGALPKAKTVLRENNSPALLNIQDDYCQIIIFQNGIIVYKEGDYATTFTITQCLDLTYDDVCPEMYENMAKDSAEDETEFTEDSVCGSRISSDGKRYEAIRINPEAIKNFTVPVALTLKGQRCLAYNSDKRYYSHRLPFDDCLDSNEEFISSCNPENQILENEMDEETQKLCQITRSVLNELKPRDRDIIVAIDIERRKVIEVAEEWGIQPSTVSIDHRRAWERFVKLLKPQVKKLKLLD